MATTEATPPHTDESERVILGALILAPECFADIPDLQPSHFYRVGNRVLFGVMSEMWQAGHPIELASVVDELKQKDKLQNAGGVQRIASLLDLVSSTTAIRHYADRIKETAHARRIVATCHEVITDLLSPGGDVDRSVGQLTTAAAETAEGTGTSKPIGEIVERQFNEITGEQDGEQPTSYVPTGIPGLDNCLHGFWRKNLIIIAARPSLGKSALALQSAIELGKRGYASGIASLEMGEVELGTRSLAYESRVKHEDIRTQRNISRHIARLNQATANLYELPIEIDDTSGASTLRLRSIARACIRRWGRCDALFADYLQIMKPPSKDRDANRQEVVAAISSDLKATAKQLDVPVVALCQLSRKAEERTGTLAEPGLYTLRESGSLEQDADVVLFLWTTEKDKSAARLPVTLTIAKQRNGPLGRVKLIFDKPTQRFELQETRYDGAAAAAGDQEF